MSRSAAATASWFRAAQATVEFALTIAVFLLMTFVTMKLALAVYNYNMVSSAAREAVRYAIAHGPNSPYPASTSQIQQVAINAAPGVNLSVSNVNVKWMADPNLPSRQDAQVQITYSYTLQIPFMTTRTLNLTSTAQMLAAQ
ncbi:MAG TPA: TadE family protein [Candidatus Binataceae bacterium]|nr:TadE family protein [Candidatus Binataceae bacterium]